MTLRYVLIADGSSDAVLHAVIRWSLRQQAPNLAIGESPTRFGVTVHPATPT